MPGGLRICNQGFKSYTLALNFKGKCQSRVNTLMHNERSDHLFFAGKQERYERDAKSQFPFSEFLLSTQIFFEANNPKISELGLSKIGVQSEKSTKLQTQEFEQILEKQHFTRFARSIVKYGFLDELYLILLRLNRLCSTQIEKGTKQENVCSLRPQHSKLIID